MLEECENKLAAEIRLLRKQASECLEAYEAGFTQRSDLVAAFREHARMMIVPAFLDFINRFQSKQKDWFLINEKHLDNSQEPVVCLEMKLARLTSTRPIRAQLSYAVAREENFVLSRSSIVEPVAELNSQSGKFVSLDELGKAVVERDAYQLLINALRRCPHVAATS
ncbi:MAG: hypothetical protein JO117_07920 [Verrucomicrobia bacterium]|nr:hypothetical protein [Verrucomicrobiota bacterium]